MTSCFIDLLSVLLILQLTPLPDIDVSRSATVPSTLMSPMQFANKQNTDAGGPDVVSGLTREQLQQALVYLIHVSVHGSVLYTY